MSVNFPNQSPHTNFKFRCIACLCLDRNLKPLKYVDQDLTAQIFPELNENSTLSHHFKLCWECEAMIKSVKKFKAKIKKAQVVLQNTIKDCNLKFHGLSNLKIAGVEMVSINPQIQVQVPPMVSVKDKMPVPMVTVKDTTSVPAPIRIEDVTSVVEIKLEKIEKDDGSSCDYDEIIQPSTIAQNPVFSDESTDSASESESVMHNDDPLLTPTMNNKIPHIILKKPLVLIKSPQKNHLNIDLKPPKVVKDIRTGPNVNLNYRPKKVSINVPSETVAPRGLQKILKVTGTVTNIVKDKNIENIVKDKDVSTVAKDKGASTAVKDNSLYNAVDINVKKIVKDSEIVPIPGIYGFDDETVEVKCVMLNRKELMEYMEGKRKELAFLSLKYKCLKCVERFHKKEYFVNHNKKHELSNGDFLCDICEQRFPEICMRDSHYKAHFVIFECLSCKFRSQNKMYISEHIRHRHMVKNFYCNRCTEVFKSHGEMRAHKINVHYKKPTCEECGKSFRTLYVYKWHMAHHKGELRECPVCKKKLPYSLYYKHIKTHREPSQKPEEIPCYCADCGIIFKNKLFYEKHLRTSLKHNTVEQVGYKCDQCDKIFAAKCSLRDHIESTHTDASYTCDICKEVLKSKRRLARHIKFKHQRIKPAEKRSMCELCGKSFKYSKAALINHMNSHLGKRPHACQLCGKTFTYQSSLFTHRRLVHKVKRKREMEKESIEEEEERRKAIHNIVEEQSNKKVV